MKKDNLIFIHKLLKAIADSIIIVFIPIYILKETNDLKLAIAYLIIFSLFVILFMFLFKKIIQKYGVICIILHFIPIIIAEGLLSFLSINIYTIIACAGLMGLQQALYSIPLNLIFTFGDNKTNVGKFMIATNIGKLIFCLISGLILSNVENSFLFLSIASSIFYISSIFTIIFAYKELKDKYNLIDKNQHKKFKLDKWFIVFHITFGLFQPIMDNAVPLYLYVNNLSFQAVTLFIVLIEFFKIIINIISQELVKRNKSIICIILSFILFMSSIIIIIFVKNSIVLYIFSTICSLSFPLTFVPMFSLYCNKLKYDNNVFFGITERDFEIFSFRAPMYALSYIGFGLTPCLIVGVVIVPIMFISEYIIVNRKNIEKENGLD